VKTISPPDFHFLKIGLDLIFPDMYYRNDIKIELIDFSRMEKERLKIRFGGSI
jgi:hypothetical protein